MYIYIYIYICLYVCMYKCMNVYINVAIVGRIQQDIHFLDGVFVGQVARPLRQRLHSKGQG